MFLLLLLLKALGKYRSVSHISIAKLRLFVYAKKRSLQNLTVLSIEYYVSSDVDRFADSIWDEELQMVKRKDLCLC